MRPDATRLRDQGLALISRINRWLVTGAVALTGAIAFLAANAFHGHTARAATTSGGASSSSSSSSGSNTVAPPAQGGQSQPSDNSGDPGSGLSAPSQVPAPAPQSQGPVVSGGS